MKTDPTTGWRHIATIFSIAAIGTSGAFAQNCASFPDFPALPISTTQDRDQMLCQIGYVLPTPPPRLLDPNRPPNAWPTQPANPDGANWTDAMGNTINRGMMGGLWVTYDGPGGPDDPGGYGFGTGDNLAVDGWQYTPIDLLKMKDGTEVTTKDQWWSERRPEVFQAIKDELYGNFPDESEWPGVSWVLGAITRGTANGVAYVQRSLTGTIDTSSYPALRNAPRVTATLRVPAAAYDAGVSVPVIISLGGTGPWQYLAPYAPGGALHTEGTHGYGICSYTPTTVQPDSGGANMSSYLIGLFNKGNWRKPGDIGSLAAWAWGISRLIDFFEMPTEFLGADPQRLGIEGHSRYGKATIVAMVYDDRILTGFPSSSGAMGAHMNRRHWGQNLESVGGTSEYHWMAGNFYKWMGPLVDDPTAPGYGSVLNGTYKPRKLELLSVDGHSLIGHVAPRIVFMNGGNTPGDAWVDPRGIYLAGVGATPVYELLGRPGLVIPEGTVYTSINGEPIGGTPPFDVPFIEGHVGFRRQNAGHTDAPGWPSYVLMSSKFFNDYTAPEIVSVSATPDVLWPPNHKMIPVTISADVWDEVDVGADARIVAVESNEPEFSGEPENVGPDWEISGSLTLNLRAERLDSGSGRTYTITVEARDVTGNTSQETVTVKVPKNMSKK